MRAQGGPLFCSAAAVPAMVRTEGVSESLGDVLLQCSGGTPRATITGNLGLMLPVAITNRVGADGLASGLTLAVNDVPLPVSGRVTGQNITFTGVSFALPDSGAATLKVTGLRGNISALGAAAQIPVTAHISSTLNTVVISNNPVTVALPQRGLLATYSSTGIPCTGSPLPNSITLSQLFATGTRFASTRVTEGYAGAFQKREGSADTGTRIVARYSDIPAGTRLFVPDAVAGSNAAQPTAGGDLGVAAAGGQYTAGALLLVRVAGADSTGVGGVPVQIPSGTFNTVSELTVAGGNAHVVYEVADADAYARESAQWPTFFGMPTVTAAGTAMETVSFGPVASEFTASTLAPIPRFKDFAPAEDCTALGDCDSDLFPHLSVNSGSLIFTAIEGGAVFQQPGYIPVQNSGGGVMPWVATLTYTNGSGWLNLEPTSGVNRGSVRVYPLTQALAAGTYKATITIDAGERAGRKALEVTLTVSPAPANPPPSPPVEPPPVPPAAPKPEIWWIHNAADARMSTLAPGGQAALRVSNLAGAAVAVAFDGTATKTLAMAADRIDVLVPAGLAGKGSAQAVITVDGRASDPRTVALAASAPGIFSNGVLNEDGTVNGDAAPAVCGSVLEIQTTGLPADLQGVNVKLHDRENMAPLSVSAMPGKDGVQQVKVTIPGDLPTMPTEVVVCAGQACSWPARVVLRQTTVVRPFLRAGIADMIYPQCPSTPITSPGAGSL